MRAAICAVRRRLSFANVTSGLALFVALGGTSYAAVTLAADSVTEREIRNGAVGTNEIRTGGVGAGELRTGSVRSPEIRTDAVRSSEVREGAIRTSELADAGVELADLSTAARTALTDASAVTFRAAISSTGAAAAGNAKGASRTAVGEYSVDLGRDVGACQFSATLAAVTTGTTVEQPPVGVVTAHTTTDNTKVVVKAFRPDGTALDAPFHLLVAC
jgi:hypothetical protein